MYEESGWLPKWELAGNETYVMVGDPATPVIADSYLKGINQFDEKLAYEAMRKGAFTPEEKNDLRPGIDAYTEFGYIPVEYEQDKTVWGSVSTTQEYNLADFGLSMMAEKLGKTQDAALLYERSMGYRSLFNSENGFISPRLKNGSWYEPFDPDCCEGWPGGTGYVEGNAWNYTFFVPHDISGVINLYGSEERFIAKLQKCFDQDKFSMSNEPDIAYPYLFNYAKGEEWHTQKEVRDAIYSNFNSSPTGLPGNDDCGTMSAWLVFSMMGFYPDCPAKPEYQLTSPIFDKITIRLNNDFYPGKSFVISAKNNSRESKYIQSMKLNGRPYEKYAVSHEEIVGGGTLVLDLSSQK